MGFSAIPLSTNALYEPINQTASGFAVGDCVRFDGTNFVQAQADNITDQALIGIVSALSGPDSFYITQAGIVSNITTQAFTPGTTYYLDPANAGRLTSTAPSTDGQYLVECFFAYSADSGFFFASAGQLIGTNPPPNFFTWNIITSNTPMVKNNGYVTTSGTISLSLPTSAAIGDIVQVAGSAGTGWVITQAAGQSIEFGIDTTTVGVTGGLSSLTSRDGVELVCIVANTTFLVISSIGTITIT
jgi:hypothetical protein